MKNESTNEIQDMAASHNLQPEDKHQTANGMVMKCGNKAAMNEIQNEQ